ncbi:MULTISPECIES: long-chain fatty acid--CoA ligase [Marivita]|uniref:3-methylmercaptopropionyl-CoA ligase n=1 Tax=Marivita cryptomonadis TaxID=505252 RepID=A0A9Q2NXP3_9RHOB|nr:MULTISPECIES: long-chain fatty acid--CoA ligase [Marivita]MBM2323109.1 long-chain fatty acid--CoA ligase [Marivita cryptomonadis]MBM2332692.1 long-chain fatty acid--CoA ligase [Marivita cryptomonadis]MBM2342275.1 long-chain fatty acid--CoA ligase [Marivita cryptomonadis]MBM2346940.1 long-chain fatty acid--CoA ligase [Marivita cryptomonadis]MBM2351617.1 long-chain fatty acid--CoA ligase [Marivita cryptomonadis]
MHGMMMNRPLSVIELLRYAAEIHSAGEIVSVRTEGDLHRQTYAETFKRTAQLAHGLAALGVQQGDRVATLAWNGYRHFELYYAISGMGAVCHTINPRLSAEQMLYIIGHAEDRVLFVDLTFVPILEALKDHLPAGLKLVVMTDAAHMPTSALDLHCYEDLIAPHPTEYDWPDLPEETAASLCYTSGTTGNPKGSLYSHRSTVLHALFIAVTLPRSLHEGARLLPVVPMFHVNSWGMPYAAPIVGASLIMPGGKLDGPSLYDLMESEKVTASWGVPTVWLGLRAEIEARGKPPSSLDQVVIGGSAAPRSMIEAFEKMDVDVCHAWGMTEMSPVGTAGQLPNSMDDAPFEDRMALKALQGRRIFGVDLKIVGENGQRLPHDGKAVGELYVRGNAVISGYFNNDEATKAAIDAEGWFGTGDVASISSDGFLSIQDRSKDLIKSGGEWISSIDLENIAMAHPEVANCAVIAIAHPKWDERPVLVVVPKEGCEPTLTDIHALMEPHFAKWQLPDDLVFVEALPLTATGKVSKLTLRKQFADYVLPDVR